MRVSRPGSCSLVLFLLTLLLSCWPRPDAWLHATPLTIDSAASSPLLTPALQVWSDAPQQASFQEAQDQFQAGAFASLPQPIIRHSWAPQVTWLYLELDFRAAGNWVFLLDYPLVHDIRFFVKRGTGAFEQVNAGNRVPAEQRPFQYRLNGLPLSVTEPSTLQIFTRIETRGQAAITPQLKEFAQLRREEQPELLLFGAFFGLIFITAIYRLGLAIRGTHQRSSILYSLLVLSQGWTYWLYSGLALQFDLAGSPEVFRNSLYLSVALLGATLVSFVGYFLRLPSWSPGWTRTFQGLLLVYLAIALFNWVFDNQAARYLFPLVAFTYVLVQVAGAVAIYRKRPFAWGTVLTFIGPAVGALVASLGAEGLLPPNFLVFYAHLFGVLIEIAILNILQARRTQWLALAALDQKQQLLDTERQLSEQLRESNLFKTELIQRASHELQTPLNGILGLLEALQEDVRRKAPELLERLQHIRNNGWRMARLIAELLDQQLLNEGRITLQLQKIDLGTLFRETLPLVQEQVLPGVKLVATAPADLPPLHADPERLQQILINLLTNAIRYTDSGTITLSAQAQADGSLEIQVHDTGTGISPEEQALIFEPMRRGKQSRGKGMGVGLSVVKELVEAHDATLHLESTVGAGSCFRIHFPASLPETPRPPAPGASGTSLPQASLLIVDDEWMNLRVVQELLEGEEVEMHLAQNGPSALQFLQQAQEAGHLPALVLLDVRMPGMDGLEVCQKIREQFSREALPVLMMTALRGLQDFEEGWEAGANDYLTKPLNRAELLARLHNWMRRTPPQPAEPAEPSPDRDQELRTLSVNLMNQALKVWEQSRKVGAIDLAQQSGIWGCYQDSQTGNWRIRSLKNYLDLNSLPKNPRWGRVARTLQFVADRCPEHPHTPELEVGLNQLTRLLQQLGRKY